MVSQVLQKGSINVELFLCYAGRSLAADSQILCVSKTKHINRYLVINQSIE